MAETGIRTAFLRRKPVDEVEQEGAGPHGGGLERTLGLWELTAIGIGGIIIGAGIFSLAGTVANEKAGPAFVVSFPIAGIASAATGLRFVVWFVIGPVVRLTHGRRHPALARSAGAPKRRDEA